MTAEAVAIATAGFRDAGVTPTTWSNGPHATYAEHAHEQSKLLFCVEGSIVFRTSDGEISMTPGSRLDLPAGTKHSAVVGADGVTCWEAFRG